MKLDANSVAALNLGGKADVIYFDDAMPGFGFRLRAGAGGRLRRSWVVQYRRGGATRRYLIGSGETLTAEQARAAARKVLAKVELGEDPQCDKRVRRTADKLSFRAGADEYLAFKQSGKRPLRVRTLFEVRRYLTGSYFRSLHAMPIDKISRRDVATRLVAITRESGNPTAARARSTLISMFVWAMKSGIIENNPVTNTPEPETGAPRERVLSDDELAAIWRASGADDYGAVIRLLILLLARRAEIGGMCWSEIDSERGTWTLPKERSKNGKAHTLPLPPMARAVIDQVPRMASRDQLFGRRGPVGFSGWSAAKLALDDRSSGVTDPWVVHDIRRTAATRMADLGISPHVIEQILNHQSGHKSGVAGICNRSSYEREVRAAMALWADHVRAVVEGGEHKVLMMPASAS